LNLGIGEQVNLGATVTGPTYMYLYRMCRAWMSSFFLFFAFSLDLPKM